MKYLKYFKQSSDYQSFKNSSEYILPNVSYVEEIKGVSFEPKKAFVLRAKYNATPDNLVAFTGASNIASLKVNGNSIKIEPIKNEIANFDVLGENISINVETGEASFPESYLIKSPVSSWSFKAKDPNYVINENTYVCILVMVDGMTLAEPMPLEEAMSYAFTTNDGVTLELVDEFLAEMNMQIQSGQIGFILMDVDMNSQTLMFIDTEHQTNVTTGGLSTYSFDSEGLYDVEIELADPVMKDMQFTETQLISIEIGDGITSMGEYAFEDCRDLTSVIIGSGVTEIGNYVFSDCSGLTDITIGSSVTEIGDYAFSSSTFNFIVVSSGNTVYDSRDNCNCLIETASNRLIKGSNNSFIPNGVTTIRENAFNSCTGLTGELVIPDSVTTIGNGAFAYCSGLTDITIGSSVTEIGGNVFLNCSSLTSITSYVQTAPIISDNTFSSINKCGTLYYPEGTDYSNWLSKLRLYSWNMTITAQYNVTSSSGYLALSSTSKISNLYVNGVEVTNFGSSYSFKAKGSYTIGIVLKDNTVNIQNMFKNVKTINSVIIHDSVASIGDYAFYECTELKSIVIPDSVKTIGKYAFDGCSELTSINIPNSVITIGQFAFNNCTGLTGELVIPDGVITIGKSAFSGCDGLTGELVIPDSVTAISSSAFYGCKGLTEVTIGSGVMEIYYKTFENCSSLESIVVSPNNTKYDSRENCNCLIETATNRLVFGCNNSFIPNGVTEIGDYAFSYCTGLTGELVIPDGVTTISDSAFRYCLGLTSITIPDSVTSISDSAFWRCKGLTSIVVSSGSTVYDSRENCNCIIETASNRLIKGSNNSFIPNGVTTIDMHAFQDCAGLTGELVIPDSVTTIGGYAFSGCSGLTKLIIGSGVTTIGNLTFDTCPGLTSITCLAPTAPSIESNTFDIKSNGTLYVPAGSDYSSWMNTDKYYLGYYNWTIQYI